VDLTAAAAADADAATSGEYRRSSIANRRSPPRWLATTGTLAVPTAKRYSFPTETAAVVCL